MALNSSYSDLLAAVADLLGRDDLTSQIADAFILCEAELNERLRTRAQQASTTLAASATPVALPTDYLEARYVRHNSAPYEKLNLVPEDWANEHDYYQLYFCDRPIYYLIEGDTLRVASKNAGSWNLDFGYWKKLDLATTTTNAVLAKYPGAYFYGTLKYISRVIGGDERAPAWDTEFESQMFKAAAADASGKWSGSTPAMRVRKAP